MLFADQSRHLGGVFLSPRAIASVVAAKRAALSSFEFYQQFKFA
jgi:hypothetical protein